MPTRNVNLTDGLDSFVAYQLESGRYENASEVVRDGLRMLVRAEREHLAKLAAIRAATLTKPKPAVSPRDCTSEDSAVKIRRQMCRADTPVRCLLVLPLILRLFLVSVPVLRS